MAIKSSISGRVEAKRNNYRMYHFSEKESNALMAFFDLAQEFRSIEDFYELCVAIPKYFFDLDGRLYLTDPKTKAYSLFATSKDDDILYTPLPECIDSPETAFYSEEQKLVLAIRGRKWQIEELPFHEEGVVGLLEIFPVDMSGANLRFFFEKYANRIGFRLQNKVLVEKNVEHLRFIRSLVADIEHNVIAPNMVYKLFLKNLKVKFRKNLEIERSLTEHFSGKSDDPFLSEVLRELADVNIGLSRELDNIEKHYRNMSLFIETLFRKSHFDQGRLTLRVKPCHLNREVVKPQLERYQFQLEKAGISIDDRLSGIPDEEMINVVDIGLIAQVYANLFSNALKYTEEIDIFGVRKKYIAYGHEVVTDFFGPGKDGSKYNVFSSGRHIPPDERERIFDEEYRGKNARKIPGTGHGLAFIKNVIEIHGGVVGYEATDYGNNFFFILPRKTE